MCLASDYMGWESLAQSTGLVTWHLSFGTCYILLRTVPAYYANDYTCLADDWFNQQIR